jgi:general secretion pathway protein H
MPTSTGARSSERGFTLLELALVLLVLAIAASMLVPRLRDIDRVRLEAGADRLATTTRFLYEEAAFRQRPMRLHLDLDHHEYWVTVLDLEGDTPEFVVDETPLARPAALPDGVAFRDVVLPALGLVEAGEVFGEFHPEGWADPLVIHLRGRRGGEATIAIEPLTGRTRIADGYVEVLPPPDAIDPFARRGAVR